MIQSFKCEQTAALYLNGKSRFWSGSHPAALRKLDQLHAAIKLDDLRMPLGNRLEPLRGDREGQSSIWINGEWRLCFVWKVDGPHDVEIVDYH